MLKKSLNEDDTNFSHKEISLNSIAKLEKKLKQLEHCQNLQNSLLLSKLMNKQKIITNDMMTTSNNKGPTDMFSSNNSCTDSNEIEHSIITQTDRLTSNGNSERKNQKWTFEEVRLYIYI